MSLLTIARTIAEEVGLPVPSAVGSSNDKQAKQLKALINRSGKAMARRNWTVLLREHEFLTDADIDSYALPPDYARIIDSTLWNRTQYWALRGPRTSREWQSAKSSLVVTTLHAAWRIRAEARVNRLFVHPTPTSSEPVVFEYASRHWVRNAENSEGKEVYESDTDVALLDEQLIEADALWRLMNRKGLAYDEEKIEAEEMIEKAYADDGGALIINLGRRRPVREFNLPEGNFNWP